MSENWGDDLVEDGGEYELADSVMKEDCTMAPSCAIPNPAAHAALQS